MEARKENPRTSRAIIRAMEFTNGVDFQNPRMLMIENCPLGVHIDPVRDKPHCGQGQDVALNRLLMISALHRPKSGRPKTCSESFSAIQFANS